MTGERREPFRLLVLCTGNSARSQMAETLFNELGRGRIRAESAGSQPALRVNPLAIEALKELGLAWKGHQPRGLDGLDREHWDFVLTVCDKAKEACPVFPGQPVLAHWGMPDPAEVVGDEATRLKAFRAALLLIRRRIELMLALPLEKLERMALEARLRAIGSEQAHG
jgi:arsenate reductase (thioredoxin)